MVTRSKGGSCVASAAYIAGEKFKNERDGKTHDYRNKHEVVHKEILLPKNAPPDFRNRAKLWNAAEAAEKRKNSQTARSINAALPRELSRVEQIDLVRQFCEQCFVSKGMCCDFAIHDKGDGNPHVHILLATRKVGKSGFTQKERAWNDKKLLIEWRERWADWCNHKLYFVSNARVDHRSYKEQGIDKLPELERQMQTVRSEHKQETIDYIESNIDCKVSDAFVIHDKQDTLEQFEKFLQSRNIPCELIFYNEDKYELFVPKLERDRALDLLTQFKNQNREKDKQNHTQQNSAPSKKHKSRI